jgi:microcompartment protein CcmK/EutM
MQLGRVIGTVVLNAQNHTLEGVTLLLVQPLSAAREPVGRAIVAADAVGAGTGEEVFFVRGKEASFPFFPTEVPADAGIVGITDHWDLG